MESQSAGRGVEPSVRVPRACGLYFAMPLLGFRFRMDFSFRMGLQKSRASGLDPNVGPNEGLPI